MSLGYIVSKQKGVLRKWNEKVRSLEIGCFLPWHNSLEFCLSSHPGLTELCDLGK